ncbi:MAG: PQQ-dependent sugar dehydrogenase [Phycisphaerae bacterium]
MTVPMPRFLAISILALGILPGSAPAQAIQSVRITNGLIRPIYVTHAPRDYARIFVIEKHGRIRIIRNGTLLTTPFLDINAIVGGGTTTQSEQGLLGLAFHPDYANNGYFFVNYTDNSGNTVVARYRVSAADPDVADPASAFTLLNVVQPFSNHNGGWTEFGPDGYLYLALGDGGDMYDPGNRAQTITNMLLGKILRIDVDGPDNLIGNADDDEFPADATKNYAIPPTNPFANQTGDDEIWAFGLRNPWRNSFDRLTGDLWIADVGQDQLEEIDFQPAGASGRNYGWRCMEATSCTNLSGCTCFDSALTTPIYIYSHALGCAITGGYVYRGCAIPGLQGTYFFADYCSNQIWSFRYDGTTVSQFVNRTAELAPGGGLSITAITSFGEDAYGELYICDQGSEVYKIVPVAAITDCNANGVQDACDIASGVSADVNQNGVPDDCECLGDLNGDHQVNEADLGVMLAAWQTSASGDANADGQTNEADLGILLANWLCNRP